MNHWILLRKKVGGCDNIDLTKPGHKNYLCDKRRRVLKLGEAPSLERCFSYQHKENPSYYYAFQLNVEELITNIF
jgi:zinc finger SWIM domain-containing protein 3